MFESPCSMTTDDLRIQGHFYIAGRGDLLDEIVGHTGGEGRPSYQQRYTISVLCQIDRRLSCGVPRSCNKHLLPAHRLGFGDSPAVENARADQGFEVRNAESPISNTHCQNHGMGDDFLSTGEAEDVVASMGAESGYFTECGELRPKQPGLILSTSRQFKATDAVRKSKIIANEGTRPRLSAERPALDDNRSQAL